MYIYGSYRKIKTGVPLFWTTLYMYRVRLTCLFLAGNIANIIQYSLVMGKVRENQASPVTGHPRTESNRTAFRRILYVEQTSGFLSELQNPGLWNDFVVEMVCSIILNA